MKEYKIVLGRHLYSTVVGNKDYAVVVSTVLYAEPGAQQGVHGYLDDSGVGDMFIIAESLDQACNLLNAWVTKTFGRKNQIPKKATKDDVQTYWNVDKSRMHKFFVPFAITEEEACELQMQLGYHPAGYGFYRFETAENATTWLCGNSSD